MIHLLTIDSIQHIDKDGNVLWEETNIPNIFHTGGQQFLLSVAFSTAVGVIVPASYYLGLDNRSTLALTDTFTSLSAEPTQFGYARQAVSSATGFNLEVDSGGNFIMRSSVVTFSASGGSWGPVRNVFLSTSASNTGFLVSSVVLGTPRTVADSQLITVRMSIGLTNC
jgi:hypothetical protein